MENIGNHGIDGARRPERERLDRVEKRRASESRRSEERREAPREREQDRIEFSSRSEDVDRIERRARELASRLSVEDEGREAKVRHVREHLDEIVNSRSSHERAADALYADVLNDRN